MTIETIDQARIKSVSNPTTQSVGSLPKHWDVKKLGDVCEKISLNKIKIKQRDYLKEGNYPIVDQGQELIGGYYNDINFVVPNEPPYIIFGDHTKVKKYINFKFVAGADGVKVLKSKTNVDAKFLYYLIHAIKIDDKGYARHFQLLEKSDFPLPPLPEQQAIVAKIEELLSELENGKQQLLTAQQQLKVYRQSLLKWAFEGKLTNKKVKDGELPMGWKLSQLGDVSDMCLGKMLDKKKNKGNYQPYLRNISVRWGQFDLSDLEEMRFESHEKERYNLKNGDLIVCEGGEPGRCAIWKGAVPSMKIQKALHRVRVKKMLSEIYLYHFMYYSAMSGLLNKYFTGTTIKHLTGRELKKIEIPLPPIKEQQLIVDELESKLTVCEKIEETINQSLQQAETLRQSILKKAFEGKLVL